MHLVGILWNVSSEIAGHHDIVMRIDVQHSNGSQHADVMLAY